MKQILNRLLFGIAISLFLSSTGIALVASESDAALKGSWAGLSNATDSAATPEKTYLSASAGFVSVRIDGVHACLLEGLSGAAKADVDANGGERWDLTVTESSDHASCKRIAQGALSIHRMPNNGKLSFQARYANAAGEQVERTGSLARYP